MRALAPPQDTNADEAVMAVIQAIRAPDCCAPSKAYTIVTSLNTDRCRLKRGHHMVLQSKSYRL